MENEFLLLLPFVLSLFPWVWLGVTLELVLLKMLASSKDWEQESHIGHSNSTIIKWRVMTSSGTIGVDNFNSVKHFNIKFMTRVLLSNRIIWSFHVTGIKAMKHSRRVFRAMAYLFFCPSLGVFCAMAYFFFCIFLRNSCSQLD